ncbi:hypothetical protein P4N68_03990 [Corynebacterium felinum]|uniref:Uncharacterized protein n=1 Tax=Corynebacterium felinum TaxID=131318 RepID=A0ABU2B8E7_9CORY|nr:hypothetical protein [Corynebacterium felinum]MDF5820246.1 hypothetical protein [Corynebacterium felinum]MDR7354887.1 hypothetical protein [Corynebacterium felinum]WJY94248.1 hypothetical protein CFELI_03030 [Corynebacterium felinum]
MDDESQHKRTLLVRESIVGFLGFLSFLAVVQAVINVMQPQPKVWPAVLALVLVIAAVSAWRWHRSH